MLIAVISSDVLGREGVAPNGTSGRCVVARCSSSLSVAVTNTDQKQLGEESVCLSCVSRSRIKTGGGPGRNSTGTEAESTEKHCLAAHLLPHTQAAYPAQDRLAYPAQDRAAQGGLGPLTPVISQDNLLQTWPQANLTVTVIP